MMRSSWSLAVLAVLAPFLAGCGGPATIHVQVNVVASGFSGGNVTVQGWDPGNVPVVDTTLVVARGANLTIASFDAKAGDYTFVGKVGDNGRTQENIPLGKDTPMFYVLVSDGGVQFSLDGHTPL